MKKKSLYCTIYLVRHGESEANANQLFGLDTKLTQKGRAQAKLLRDALKKIHFDAIVSSPYIRVQQTVGYIAKERKLEILTKEALRERHEGILNGRSTKELTEEIKKMYELRRTLPYKKWKSMSVAEGWEPDEKLMSRIITELREIAVAYPGKTILIGSHVGIIKTFLVHLGMYEHKHLPSSVVKNTAYLKLKTDGVDFFIEEMNGIDPVAVVK